MHFFLNSNGQKSSFEYEAEKYNLTPLYVRLLKIYINQCQKINVNLIQRRFLLYEKNFPCIIIYNHHRIQSE